MIEYPTLDELHAIRQKMWEEAGGTVEGLFQMIHKMEQQHPERLVDLSGRGKSKTPKRPTTKKKQAKAG